MFQNLTVLNIIFFIIFFLIQTAAKTKTKMLITLDFDDIPNDFKLGLDCETTWVSNQNAQNLEKDWISAVIIGKVFLKNSPKGGIRKLLRMTEGILMKIQYTENLSSHVKSIKITTRNNETPMIMNVPETKKIIYSTHKNNYNKYFCIEMEF